MVATLSVVIFSAFILVCYLSALLIFTPDDKEDKYIRQLLEKGFLLYDSPKGEVFSFLKKGVGYAIIVLLYKILHTRRKID